MRRHHQPDKLTPGANLLWESSRMMLPEHKERILEHRKNLKRRKRPELDEQKLEEINRALQHSMQYRTEVELVLYGAFENRTLRGKVTWVDRGQIKMATLSGGFEWVETRDILDVY